MKSLYSDRIRTFAGGHDPRHIEGYMRLQYSSLDGLDAATFAREVMIARECRRGRRRGRRTQRQKLWLVRAESRALVGARPIHGADPD